VLGALSLRARHLDLLQSAWSTGDAVRLVSKLDALKDDALSCSALVRLQSHTGPVPPKTFANLLPLVHRLVNSSTECHAVGAMRFALHALDVWWPSVSCALANVPTSRAAFEACEEVAWRLGMLYALVKGMTGSVRVSRTNGPLLPTCKKLRAALEAALAAAGRLPRKGGSR